MTIYALDDERLMLASLTDAIRAAEPNAQIYEFMRSSALITEMEQGESKPDVVFTDIEMPGLSGMELAKRIKLKYPQANIVFVTGFSQFALEALSLFPSGYVMKPVTAEKIRTQMENLRYRIEPASDKRIRIQTFGNFEVFCDGEPVRFSRSKSKEVLAFLVDKQGTGSSMAEIADVIWEDGIFDTSRQGALRVYIADLKKDLAAVSATDIVIKTKNSLMLDKSKVVCDLYQFMDGNIAAINSYKGEYMYSYPWAEFTTAYLHSKQ